ncbi:uncharacterized protein LOC125178346, partial [Hyalella azteca]|uniref:Uncharacterized protein LOC125178346 n=1 Tax=Hyalella azteca TaxID=294128 RepID=A0A979FMV1_HYAAZ
MASAGSSASCTPPAPAGGLPGSMETIYRSVVGNLHLSPKIMRFVLSKECQDKRDDETYRQYMDRLRTEAGQEHFTNKEWKQAFSFNAKTFETVKNSDEQDVTAIHCLLKNLYTKVSKVGRKDHAELLKKLTDVKDWRNTAFHNLQAVHNDSNFSDLKAALVDLIDEAGRFYSLPPVEIDAKKWELENESMNLVALNKESIYYWCSRLLMSGKEAVRHLWEERLSSEELLLNSNPIKVKRLDVFHAPQIKTGPCDEEKVLPYIKIFETFEEILVVTGVAGAGKTTLVKNIVLQFINPPQGVDDYLSSFDQFIFFECRDRTTEKLSDIIKDHFNDLCNELGHQVHVLDAILRLRVLFIIDGFDEVNKNSLKVVNEILKKTWRRNCRVLITTRPHVVEKKLAPLLRRCDVSSTQYEILPLKKLADQLVFLRRYEAALSGDTPTGEMTRSFESLSEDVRSQFLEPINLVHFCEMHKHLPEEISTWRSPGDVAPSKLRLYRKLISAKLVDWIDEDLDVLVDDMFALVGAEALELLRDNVVTFSETEFGAIKRRCQVKLKGDDKFDPEVVLSVVLKEHKPLGLNRSSSYQFKHKSEQEMFAGHYIVQRIVGGSDDPLYSILGVTKEGMRRSVDRNQRPPGAPADVREMAEPGLWSRLLEWLRRLVKPRRPLEP